MKKLLEWIAVIGLQRSKAEESVQNFLILCPLAKQREQAIGDF
jgi:hypothetical protein